LDILLGNSGPCAIGAKGHILKIVRLNVENVRREGDTPEMDVQDRRWKI
jgi:hypothetical protein